MKALENPRQPLFSAEFIVADATKVIFFFYSFVDSSLIPIESPVLF